MLERLRGVRLDGSPALPDMEPPQRQDWPQAIGRPVGLARCVEGLVASGVMETATQEIRMADGGALDDIPQASAWDSIHRVWHFKRNTLAVTRMLHEKYGTVVLESSAVTRALGLPPLLHLFGPEANRLVTLDRNGVFSARRSWDMIMGKIFRNGLLLRDGADHRHHRKIMQHAFTVGALRAYMQQMNRHVAEELGQWPTDGKPMPVYPAFKKLTLNLAAEIFLGIELGAETDRLNRAFEATVAASMSIVRLRIPGLEFERGLRGRQYMIDFFRCLLPTRRATETPDLFSRLCHAESEDGDRYSDEEIIDHLIFLMMAAHDTTTSTLTSMTYLLATHPEWQERVREESRAIDDDFLDYDDMGRLNALNQVMQETLRMFPPLSTIPRVNVAPFEIDGYSIPPGCMVAVYPIHTHYMPEWWTVPERFDPERFSDQRAEHKRHGHTWIPFGAGPHTCLGMRFAEMQIRAIMHQLVRGRRWSVADGYRMPVQQAPISKPLDGLPVSLAESR